MRSRPGSLFQTYGDDALAGFDPSDLFQGSEAGAVFDPSDLSSVIPAVRPDVAVGDLRYWPGGDAAAGDVVGGLIDKSQLGDTSVEQYLQTQYADTASNLYLASAVEGDWNEENGATITSFSNQSITVTGDGATNFPKIRYTPRATTVSGLWYVTEATFTNNGATSKSYALNTSSSESTRGQGTITQGASATFRALWKATDTSGEIVFVANSSSTESFTVTDIRVYPLPGNHLIAPSDAARPVLYDDVPATHSLGDALTFTDTLVADDLTPRDGNAVITDETGGVIRVLTSIASYTFGNVTTTGSVANTWYYYSIDVRAGGGGACEVRPHLGDATTWQYTASTDWVTITGYYRQHFSGAGFGIYQTQNTANAYVEFRNMEYTPITGPHYWYLDCDGTDDNLDATFSPGTTATIITSLQTSDTTFVLHSGGGADDFYLAVEDGSSSTSLNESNTVGRLAEAIRIDGGSTSPSTLPTRDDIHTALGDGTSHVVIQTALDFTAWPTFGLVSDYGGYEYDGRIYSCVVTDTTPTTEQIDRLETWSADKSGATLNTRKTGVADLFDANSTGAWYDPSDLSSMYKRGFVPLAGSVAPGDTVGTIIDKSQLGGQSVDDYLAGVPDVFSDPDFENGVGDFVAADAEDTLTWTGNGIATAAAGASDYRSAYAFIQNSVDVGEYYLLEVVQTNKLGSGKIRGGATGNSTTYFDVGTGGNDIPDRFLIYTTTADFSLTLGLQNSTDTVEFSRVSLKKLPGNHIVAPSDAARPVLRSTPNPIDVSKIDPGSFYDGDNLARPLAIENGINSGNGNYRFSSFISNDEGPTPIKDDDGELIGAIIARDQTSAVRHSNSGVDGSNLTLDGNKWYMLAFRSDPSDLIAETNDQWISSNGSSGTPTRSISNTNTEYAATAHTINGADVNDCIYVFTTDGTSAAGFRPGGANFGGAVKNIILKELGPVNYRYYLDFDGTDDNIAHADDTDNTIWAFFGLYLDSDTASLDTIANVANGTDAYNIRVSSNASDWDLNEGSTNNGDFIYSEDVTRYNGGAASVIVEDTPTILGAKVGSAPNGVAGNTIKSFGGRGALSRYLSGGFYGMLIFGRDLTDDEKSIIEGDLNKKSGAY